MRKFNWPFVLILVMGFIVFDGFFNAIWNFCTGHPVTEYQTYAFWGVLSGLLFGVLSLKYSSEEDPTDKPNDEGC